MNKLNKLIIGVVLLATFVIWTVLVKVVDVQPIGLSDSKVGFATFNKVLLDAIDYNETLFRITDFLMYSVIGAAAIFGLIGLIQWIKRKNILKVDHQILLLGLAYIVVIAAYFIFDKAVIINYRPVYTSGSSVLESSYPSSHTMTALFVFISAMPMVSYLLADHRVLKDIINVLLIVLAVFTVVGRIFSGAHWFSDIVGGALFATGLFFLWEFFVDFVSEKKGVGKYAIHDERN